MRTGDAGATRRVCHASSSTSAHTGAIDRRSKNGARVEGIRAPPDDSAARARELLRLFLFLDQPDLGLDAVRLYVLDRLDTVYPLDCHVYRRRWHACAPGEEPGPRLGFLEWHALVSKLQEKASFAELMGDTVEVGELRRVLLVQEQGSLDAR